MKIYRIRNFEEYQKHNHLMQKEYLLRNEYEKGLLPRRGKKIKVTGYSYPAGKIVKFHVDYIHQSKEGLPNWRETLLCPDSRLNNRMRASVHLFEAECGPYRQSRIYISEQVTPLYKYFAASYTNVTGSEFIGEGLTPGNFNSSGIRHEDLTNLSFSEGSFDYFLSFDCFEHIPDYQKAFGESYRVLVPGGIMFFSVPFSLGSPLNTIRARITAGGGIEHLLEPEYHGDPFNKSGCLSYRSYGWEMLDELRNVGFRDTYALLYWSRNFGYLGGEQVLFVAVK